MRCIDNFLQVLGVRPLAIVVTLAAEQHLKVPFAQVVQKFDWHNLLKSPAERLNLHTHVYFKRRLKCQLNVAFQIVQCDFSCLSFFEQLNVLLQRMVEHYAVVG